MTTQYKYLIKPAIVQAGDEFKIISNQDVWAPSFRVGQEVINGRYRRPIAVETKQKDCGSITEAQREVVLNFGGNPPLFVYHTAPDAVGAALDDASEQRAQNRELTTRLENALKDVVIAEARKDEYYRKVVERGNYINNLTARLMDKEAVIRRLKEKLENVVTSHAQITAAESQRNNWEKTAAQHLRNEQYYRGLLVQIGELFGLRLRICDDGSVSEGVVVAALPNQVKRLLVCHEMLVRQDLDTKING